MHFGRGCDVSLGLTLTDRTDKGNDHATGGKPIGSSGDPPQPPPTHIHPICTPSPLPLSSGSFPYLLGSGTTHVACFQECCIGTYIPWHVVAIGQLKWDSLGLNWEAYANGQDGCIHRRNLLPSCNAAIHQGPVHWSRDPLHSVSGYVYGTINIPPTPSLAIHINRDLTLAEGFQNIIMAELKDSINVNGLLWRVKNMTIYTLPWSDLVIPLVQVWIGIPGSDRLNWCPVWKGPWKGISWDLGVQQRRHSCVHH